MKKKYLTIILPFFFIFLTSFLFLALFEFNKKMPLFSGEDSFYHVGMAKFILEHGIVQKFPYLYFTTLNTNFVDHELLFHLILIPFIKLLGDNAGPKIADILFFSLAFSFSFLVLKEFKLKFAWLYPILLLFLLPSDFYFRIAFIRVQSAALFFMTLAIYFILKNNKIGLALISFLFVWLYGGSVFLPALIIFYLISQILIGQKINWTLISYGLIGFALGLIANPYFPKNIFFLYSQIFQTGIGAKSYSGGEWRPYDSWYWATISIVPILIFFGGMIIALAKNIKIDAKKLTLLLFSFFLLILQWKSKRFVEYWPFFAGLSGIILAGKYLEEKIPEIKTNKEIFLIAIFATIAGLFLVYKANLEITRGYSDTQTSVNVATTKEVNDYLIKNSQPGEIIFTDDWDVFPFYFFFNRRNYYIVGLDPEFMNQYNHTLYEEYAEISSGSDSNNLERIKDDFHASWVLVGFDHPEFNFNLTSKPELFDKVFENRDYTLFKVKQ